MIAIVKDGKPYPYDPPLALAMVALEAAKALGDTDLAARLRWVANPWVDKVQEIK